MRGFTRDIHETIIKAAADLISVETPDYQYLAARLAIFTRVRLLMESLNHRICMLMLSILPNKVNMISTFWQITVLMSLMSSMIMWIITVI